MKKLSAVLDIIESCTEQGFARSDDFGFIASHPINVGTGMKISSHYCLPNLTKTG